MHVWINEKKYSHGWKKSGWCSNPDFNPNDEDIMERKIYI
jgi:hypothetical protein